VNPRNIAAHKKKSEFQEYCRAQKQKQASEFQEYCCAPKQKSESQEYCCAQSNAIIAHRYKDNS
jgi:hypothetical protein